jgi:hypothetical protein
LDVGFTFHPGMLLVHCLCQSHLLHRPEVVGLSTTVLLLRLCLDQHKESQQWQCEVPGAALNQRRWKVVGG